MKSFAAFKETHLRQHDVHIFKTVFWSAILLTIMGNILIAFILIPFLIVLSKIALYSIIFLLGGTMGLLYNHLLKDIHHLELKHHLAAGIIIPLIAAANIIMVVLVSNHLILDLHVQNPRHDPWIAALVFACAFILPTVVHRVHSKIRRKNIFPLQI